MKLSTKNIDKAIRRLKSNYRRKTFDCCGCGKRGKWDKDYIGVINGFGGLNYYHPDCLLKRSAIQDI